VRQPALPPFSFACPACGTPLEWITPTQQLCPQDRSLYASLDGVWRFLSQERLSYYRQFMEEYEEVRRAEGRGSTDPAYYRSLPYAYSHRQDPHGWGIRLRSYQALIQRILPTLETTAIGPLAILDLGAGNGWLSYRLAKRGHSAAAVDLLTNDFDGLGAYRYYDAWFTPLQAEFDRLPFTRSQFDLAIFNASFHYSTDYTQTLQETLRVLKPGLPVVILDSPIYRDGSSGSRMVQEREAHFTRRFGFPSNALPSQNFLTIQCLKELSEQLGLKWQALTPFYGLRWALRPIKARLLGRREPAQFRLLIGRRG
jgi:SAM-dependent methyltransferase